VLNCALSKAFSVIAGPQVLIEALIMVSATPVAYTLGWKRLKNQVLPIQARRLLPWRHLGSVHLSLCEGLWAVRPRWRETDRPRQDRLDVRECLVGLAQLLGQGERIALDDAGCNGFC
jgi:hypothetical protein